MASTFSLLLCFLSLLSLSSFISSSEENSDLTLDLISSTFSSSSSSSSSSSPPQNQKSIFLDRNQKSFISDIISSIQIDKQDGGSIKIVIPLNKIRKFKFADVWRKLTHIVNISISRAENLKNLNKTHSGNRTALYSKSYGEYAVSLKFGTPPQTIPFIVDTGSDPVWFPCTPQYICSFCNQTQGADPRKTPNITTFDPKLSSSSKITECDNPICRSLHPRRGGGSKCKDCPPYWIEYGSGATNGSFLSETLIFDGKKIPNFVVGCSSYSINMPTGLAGFGRGPPSLPSQLGLRKFSHCLISRSLNETAKNSPLVLYSGSDSDDDEKIDGIKYTPLLKSPKYPIFYYMDLNEITVGGKTVDIPDSYLSLRSDGNGGAIIDSGSTFTFLERRIYDKVAAEIDNQVAHYRRVEDVEESVRLSPCYEVPKERASFPKVGFHFEGGAKMELPVVNTFWFIDTNVTRVACLAIVSSDGSGLSDGGPAIILGNFQQQNFYVEYDLKNERLGFREQDCNE